MSPEVLRARNTKEYYLCERADVFAIGVIIYALIIYEAPFMSDATDDNERY